MIIKATRHATAASVGRVIEHLFRGAENDAVTVLQGSERDLRDAWRDARAHGVTKALRVWILAPAVETSREQAMDAFARLAGEFAFDLGRAVIVEHDKERTTPHAFDRHWHCAVGEADPVTGRVLSSSHDMPRHEFLSRSLEHLFGQPFVMGAHTPSVLARMRREGQSAMADALDAAFLPVSGKDPPREAFPTADHQRAKRKGIDLAEEREIVTAVWSTATTFAGLQTALAAQGLELSPGDKPGEWLVFRGGEQLGALRRLTKTRKADFASRMKEITDADNDDRRPGQDLRGTDPGGTPGDARGPGQPHDAGFDPDGLRRPAVAADGREGRGQPPSGNDALNEPPCGRDRGNPQAPRSTGVDALRPPHGFRAPGRDRQLIGTARSYATAVFGLVQRATVVATPAPARVQVVLGRYEAADRAVQTSLPKPLPRVHIDALKAREKAARAEITTVSTEIDAVSARISSLRIEQRRRERSPWLRWLPNRETGPVIAGLEEHRDVLRSRHAMLTQDRLRAEVKAKRASNALVVAQAEADRDHASTLRVTERRLAIVARARKLIRSVPTLAYLGAKVLLAMATRIEKAREQGWDSGPSVTPP